MAGQNKTPAYKKDYPWALNKIKLNEAITDLETMHARDASIEITEETIKFRYSVRKGAILKSAKDIEDEAKAAHNKKLAEARELLAAEESKEEEVEETEEKKSSKKTAKESKEE